MHVTVPTYGGVYAAVTAVRRNRPLSSNHHLPSTAEHWTYINTMISYSKENSVFAPNGRKWTADPIAQTTQR